MVQIIGNALGLFLPIIFIDVFTKDAVILTALNMPIMIFFSSK